LNSILQTLLDCLLDSVLDVVKALPFLFGAYLLIEFIEHKSTDKFNRTLANVGKYSPAAGALLGLIPQCGISVSAANLYSGGIITGGTIIAVFLATSDEAIPVLLTHPERYHYLLLLVIIKFVSAMIFGFLFDILFKNNRYGTIDSFHSEMHSHCEDECCEHGIVHTAFFHTLKSALFLFIMVFIIGTIVEFTPTEYVEKIFMTNSALQTVFSAIIGFVPTCATSIMLSELYLSGVLSFGSLCAGLMTNAGFGIIALLRVGHNRRKNTGLAVYMFVCSVVTGLIIQAVM